MQYNIVASIYGLMGNDMTIYSGSDPYVIYAPETLKPPGLRLFLLRFSDHHSEIVSTDIPQP